MVRTYRYSFDRRLILFWAPFGVRPAKDWVTLTDGGRLVATFGLLKLETPLENISGAHITRNYRWWTAAGARGSMKDDGLTFGTNANAGVCIHFRTKVPSRLRRKGHSALTVTVEDLDGLANVLTGGTGGTTTPYSESEAADVDRLEPGEGHRDHRTVQPPEETRPSD